MLTALFQTLCWYFIGEKIKVKEVKRKGLMFNQWFKVRYKVLESIYGDFQKQKIEFTVADHFGVPAFSNYDHVLLFVRLYGNRFHHVKYRFCDLYKTKDGRWASPYDSHLYSRSWNNHSEARPEKIEFCEEVFYTISPDLSPEEIREYFPTPFFRLEENRAYAVYGNYLEELLFLTAPIYEPEKED